jgi:hypothetical protein
MENIDDMKTVMMTLLLFSFAIALLLFSALLMLTPGLMSTVTFAFAI